MLVSRALLVDGYQVNMFDNFLLNEWLQMQGSFVVKRKIMVLLMGCSWHGMRARGADAVASCVSCVRLVARTHDGRSAPSSFKKKRLHALLKIVMHLLFNDLLLHVLFVTNMHTI